MRSNICVKIWGEKRTREGEDKGGGAPGGSPGAAPPHGAPVSLWPSLSARAPPTAAHCVPKGPHWDAFLIMHHILSFTLHPFHG